MPILDEIERFFAAQPSWQRQAYAALRSGRELTDQLYEELTKECIRNASDAAIEDSNGGSKTSDPLTEKRLSTVSLRSIENVRHVDSLVPNQSLSFAPTGLTIVYGDNGAGKTGYGRILRQVCRARGPAPALRSNVFFNPETDCSASVKFSNDGIEKCVVVARGAADGGALRNFCIFDSGAAASLVNEQNATAFRPFGLDLLDRFSAIADEVKRRIQSELSRTATAFIDVEEFAETTKAGRLVRNLASFSDEDEIELKALAKSQEIRRTELGAILAQAKISDPSKVAQATSAKALRYQQLHKRLLGIASSLGHESVRSFIALKGEVEAVQRAAETARIAAFSNETLKGVGESTWRHLWEAAKQYSVLAGVGEPFENAKVQDLCVLCGQPLAPAAADRMQTLESFVKGELQEKAKQLKEQMYQTLETFNDQPLQQAGDDALLQELSSDDETLTEEVRGFLKSAADLVKLLQEHYASGSSVSTDTELVAPKALGELVVKLRSQALEIQKSATPMALASQQNEFSELEAQAKLAEHEASVENEIARLNAEKNWKQRRGLRLLDR